MSFPSHSADKAPPIPGPGEVLTLEQVAAADFSGVTPLGVLGYPIKHSVSPQMHNAALAELAKTDPKFASWRYYRIEVQPERLKEALDLLAAKGFVGLNLTLPHKVLATQWVKMGDIVGSVSGAVNTLRRAGDGWVGTNTDGIGFMYALRQEPVRETITDAEVVLLGAGGAARALAAICLTQGCRHLWIGNRSEGRLSELVGKLRPLNHAGIISGFDLKDAAHAVLPKIALVINATSLGLSPEDPSPIDLSIFSTGTKVFDTTYGTQDSAFIKQAKALRFPVANGLMMLVFQGYGSLDDWLEHSDVTYSIDIRAMVQAAFTAKSMPVPQSIIVPVDREEK
jgi:shikimate dehydrogenase